jgi:hypothetical protein
MKKRTWIGVAATFLLLCAAAFYAYQRWGGDPSAARANTLAAMPAGASAVVFADLAELRQSPFVTELYAWAPHPQVDADYTQFLRDTGFDYERDLDRVAIAAIKRGQDTTFFAVADGRFDPKKIAAYASRSGTREARGGREIFSVPVSGNPRKVSLTFLRNDRIAVTDAADLAALLSPSPSGQDAQEWRTRFERLAGSPIFAVIRQDAAPGSALALRAPDADRLRVVTEGECSVAASARQLADFLNGALLLAQAGLNGPQVRQQLDPQTRDSLLEMLKGADVSRIDRGETKSVRLVFDVTPKLLQAARTAVPAVVPSNSAPTTLPSPPGTSRHK